MPVALSFSTDAAAAVAAADQLVFVGTRAALGRADVVALAPEAARAVWSPMLEALAPGDAHAATSTWIERAGATPLRVSLVAVSDRASRHNVASRPDQVAQALKGRAGKGRVAFVIALDRAADAFAVGAAAARAFPLYTKKKKAEEATAEVALVAPPDQVIPAAELTRIAAVARAIREAQRMVDMPASELHTDAFVAEAEAVASAVGATITVLRGDELVRRGLGGIASVGQAATRGPALVHLAWVPTTTPEAAPPMAWVGKGIVYDTGGLSLKGKTDMPGMKNDMGGAAAVLQGFRAAVELGAARRLDAVLCLAENSVGPQAMRPDDIITLYSGKTVEVNNTDAEGRLVLADGVAYATRDLEAPIVVDLATLTGAQLMATGKLHAAIVSNDEALEAQAVAAGKRSGDLVFPLPYAPELYRAELTSPVADLRNSVKDRMNAQASCAAQFIAESLTDPATRWLHVDMAGPVTSRDRGTGFGVAFLVALADGAR
ncbi:MAG: leucyl aminopeptidase family protein [Deltaproteobacteria bacterium]|nr:leucyl aminopeptidase family protein [Deltaproteobacteria bacterium]